MKIPTKPQLLDYFKEYHIPKNIFEHCEKVREVSVFLAEELQKAGEEVDLDLVHALALVHDMFKTVVLKELVPNEEYHPEPFTDEEINSWKKLKERYRDLFEGEVAYDIFKDEYPEFALKIRNATNPIAEKDSWETLIVHYADWRVSKDQILLLPERLDYILKKYKLRQDFWEKSCEIIKKDEAKIFIKLRFAPDELKEQTENGR